MNLTSPDDSSPLTAPMKRPIAQSVDWIDINGNIMWRFASGSEAADFLGVTSSSVSQCTRGKTKTAGGATLKLSGGKLDTGSVLFIAREC